MDEHPTEVAKQCGACGNVEYPCVSPAVIVRVEKNGQILLAKHAQRSQEFWTCLAGYVEVGESLEDCVHREVAEEVGVALTSLRYVVSQPWPMPRSLMLGFEASTEDTRIQVDGDEIVAGEFFSRADLAAAVSSGEVVLPGGASIARHLIERWLTAG